MILLAVSYASLKPHAEGLQICEMQRRAGFAFTGIPLYRAVRDHRGEIHTIPFKDGTGAGFVFISPAEQEQYAAGSTT